MKWRGKPGTHARRHAAGLWHMFDRHPRRLCLNGLRLDALAEWPSDVAPEARMAQARARRFCRLAALQPDGPHDGGRRGASDIARIARRRYAHVGAIRPAALCATESRVPAKRRSSALERRARGRGACAVQTGHVNLKHVQAANRQSTCALDQGGRRAVAAGAPTRCTVLRHPACAWASAHARIRRGRRGACRLALPCRSIPNCKSPHASMACRPGAPAEPGGQSRIRACAAPIPQIRASDRKRR